MRCRGYKSNGNRCKITWNLNDMGYCTHHKRQGYPNCQGVDFNGMRCTNTAKQSYEFCCAAHDPTLPHIAPRIMDPVDFYLRRQVESDVVARYDGKDIYNRGRLDLDNPSSLELDHIVEKQCFTYAIAQMGLRQGDDDFATAVDILRDDCVNELDNLALTRRSTNRIKGAGVWKYLDDLLTGHVGQKFFTSYLQVATRDGEPLTRDVTRRICHHMGKSTRKTQRKLSDEGETPVLEQLSEQLQQLYVDMELNVRR